MQWQSFAYGLAVLLVNASAARAEPTCDPPQVLLVVDRSSSMTGVLEPGLTKWDAAGEAVRELLESYEDVVAFGLQIFPSPAECDVTAPIVPPASATKERILAELGEPPPRSGSYTPMAETLALLTADDVWPGGAASRYAVLITDGWQWCYPHEPSRRFAPVASVDSLTRAGVTVHVVGFGAGVDVLTLSRMALAAGTAPATCDPDAEDSGGADACYAQANDLSGLRLALERVAARVTEETCDGLDNDCDGIVDEEFDVDHDGVSTCADPPDCDDDSARTFPGAPEACDGIDNDCDGRVDSDCVCRNEETLRCGIAIGACRAGTQTCRDGAWGPCEGAALPAPETCDGVDNDCDGRLDEGELCDAGTTCFRAACLDMTVPAQGAGCGCGVVGRGANTRLNGSGSGASLRPRAEMLSFVAAICGLFGLEHLRRRRRRLEQAVCLGHCEPATRSVGFGCRGDSPHGTRGAGPRPGAPALEPRLRLPHRV